MLNHLKNLFFCVLIFPLYAYSALTEIGYNTLKVKAFVDYENIISGKNTKLIKALYDFEIPNQQFNKPHFSEIEVIELNCKSGYFRLPQITWYSKNTYFIIFIVTLINLKRDVNRITTSCDNVCLLFC